MINTVRSYSATIQRIYSIITIQRLKECIIEDCEVTFNG